MSAAYDPKKEINELKVAIATLSQQMETVLKNIPEINKSLKSTNDEIVKMRIAFQKHNDEISHITNMHKDERKERELLEKRVTAVEKNINRILPVIQVIVWIGAALGLSVIALLWSIITGQVILTFT